MARNAKSRDGDGGRALSFKMVLLGDCNVGKTSVFCRFRDGTFNEQQKSTMGIDSCSVIKTFNGTQASIVLWDTAGTERFRTLTQNYYRNSHACLLVYSVDDPESLACLGQWVEDANTYAEAAIKILVGNKTDRKHLVDYRKVEEFATHYNCDLIFQVSAKLGEGVEEMFTTLAHKLVEREARTRNQTSRRLFDEIDNDILTPRRNDKFRLTWSCCG